MYLNTYTECLNLMCDFRVLPDIFILSLLISSVSGNQLNVSLRRLRSVNPVPELGPTPTSKLLNPEDQRT